MRDLNELIDREWIKTKLSKKEFIELYDSIASSRQFHKLLEGRVSRGFLDTYYKDCKHIAFSEVRQCKKCQKSFKHLVKSRRDSTKFCPDCKKLNMAEVSKKYIKGKASHKRLLNTDSSTLDSVRKKLEGTYFKKVEASDKSERHVKLTCVCGKYIECLIKHAKKPPKTRKNSCGCKRKAGISQQEKSLSEFVKTVAKLVSCNKKPSFMKGLELDIYLPDKKIALEYHGLAFHSERTIYRRKSLKEIKSLHETKYQLCKKEGIQLIQIFGDEWRINPKIIKSMIISRLQLSSNRIFARKTKIKEIKVKERKPFFEATHIAGDVVSKTAFGLYHEGVLVSAISLRGTWNKAYGKNVIEIARFSSNLNTQVIGGFSKLLKAAETWAIEQGYTKILTYADCRFGEGTVYSKNGFEFKGKTKPNYFYEKGGIREGRFNHRKRVDLEGSTEREQQNKLGWYAIYDAGNNIYIKKL